MEFVTDPWNWWIEPFTSNPFMRDALYAGLLAVLATSVVGTWVVLRGMSFLGDALAHGVLPGIAIAFVIGVDTTIGALVAALVMVGGINVIKSNLARSHSPLSDDTSIGILFVGFLALAVVIMSSQSGFFTGDLNRFLFGSITGITTSDLRNQAIAAFVSVLGVVIFHRAFLALTFDEIQASVLGLRPRLAHGALLVLLAVSIVASFQVVGNLLVFAFLIAPPATATLLVRRVSRIMLTAILLGAVAVFVGLLISFHHDTAAGATLAVVAVVIFIAVLFGRSLVGTLLTRSVGASMTAGRGSG